MSRKHSSNVALAWPELTSTAGDNTVADPSSQRAFGSQDNLAALLAFPSEIPEQPPPTDCQPITIEPAPEASEKQTPTVARGSKRHVLVFVLSAACLAAALLFLDRRADVSSMLEQLETPAVYSGISISLLESIERVDMRAPTMPRPQRRSEIEPQITDEQAVRRMIRSFEEAYQGLGLQNCVVALTGEQATAECRGTLQLAATLENPVPMSSQQQWRFRMRREGQAWKIAEVSRTAVASLPE